MKRVYFYSLIITVIFVAISCSFKSREEKLIADLKSEEKYKEFESAIKRATTLKREISQQKTDEFVVPEKKPTAEQQKTIDSLRRVQEKLERMTVTNEKGETQQSLFLLQVMCYKQLFQEYVVEKKMDKADFNKIMGKNLVNQFFDS